MNIYQNTDRVTQQEYSQMPEIDLDATDFTGEPKQTRIFAIGNTRYMTGALRVAVVTENHGLQTRFMLSAFELAALLPEEMVENISDIQTWMEEPTDG